MNGTCIITGAGSGIGKATAIMLSERRFFDCFALVGRNEADMNLTRDEMLKNGFPGEVRLYLIDLAFPEKIPTIIEKIETECGNIAALLNIAGYTDPEPLLATTLESFELTYKVNVYAPFMFMRECVKYMRQHGGKTADL